MQCPLSGRRRRGRRRFIRSRWSIGEISLYNRHFVTVDLGLGHEDDRARRLSSKADVENTELRLNPPRELYVEMEDEWRTLS